MGRRVEEEQMVGLQAPEDVGLTPRQILLRAGQHGHRHGAMWLLVQDVNQMVVLGAETAPEDDAWSKREP